MVVVSQQDRRQTPAADTCSLCRHSVDGPQRRLLGRCALSAVPTHARPGEQETFKSLYFHKSDWLPLTARVCRVHQFAQPTNEDHTY